MRPTMPNRTVLLSTVDWRGRRVADVGCGDGRLARLLADDGAAARVVGIECSPRQLAKAHALPPHPRVSVVEGVGQALPLADHSQDGVVFFNSLHHIPPAAMAEALAEAVRVLVPGGLIYCSEPLAEGNFYALCRPVDDEAAVRALAQQALDAAEATHGLRRSHVIETINPVRLDSFAAFRDRLVSANSAREALFDRQDAMLRAMFADLAEAAPDGASVFYQPTRVVVLEKPAA